MLLSGPWHSWGQLQPLPSEPRQVTPPLGASVSLLGTERQRLKTKPSARQQLLTACGVPICGQNKGREIQGASEIKTASEALLLRAFVSN